MHVLMYGRPTKELAKTAEIEGLATPATTGRGAEQMSDPATLRGLFPRAEDEIATAWMITALGEHVAEAAKQRAETAGRSM